MSQGKLKKGWPNKRAVADYKLFPGLSRDSWMKCEGFNEGVDLCLLARAKEIAELPTVDEIFMMIQEAGGLDSSCPNSDGKKLAAAIHDRIKGEGSHEPS